MNQVRTSVSWKTLPSVVCINPTLGRVSRTVQLQEFRCGIVGFLILVSNRNFCTFLVYIQAGFFCCFFFYLYNYGVKMFFIYGTVKCLASGVIKLSNCLQLGGLLIICLQEMLIADVIFS